MNWFKRFGKFDGTDWCFFVLLSLGILYIAVAAVAALVYGAPWPVSALLFAFVGAGIAAMIHTINFVTGD